MQLTDQEQAILDFERTWWTRDEAKDVVVRDLFKLEIDQYYRTLNDLIDRPSALSYDPLVVRRLRRLRDRRRRDRTTEAVLSGELGEEA